MSSTLRRIARFQPRTPVEAAQYRETCLYFLNRTVAPRQIESIAMETFSTFEMKWQTVIYWMELDELYDHYKHFVFELVAQRLRSLATPELTATELAFHTRQLIEATLAAVHYQFGITCAYNFMCRVVEDGARGHFRSAHIESFVRGPFAPSSARERSGFCAAGQRSAPDYDRARVDETDPSFRKLAGVATFVAGKLPPTGTRLETSIAVLDNAYFYVCGLVHVTPLLMATVLPPTTSTVPGVDLAQIVGRTVAACGAILQQLFFHERFEVIRFIRPALDMIPHGIGDKILLMDVPVLEDLKHGNDAVVFRHAGGALEIYNQKVSGPQKNGRKKRKKASKNPRS